MKKLIERFKSQPLPIKLIQGAIILWAYPFIEAAVIGVTDWGDVPIHSLTLLGIGGLIFFFLFIRFFIMPVGYWIGLGGKWFINLFKKKN